MKITLTSMLGDTKSLNIPEGKTSLDNFISQYQKMLPQNLRVKITCDILGVDGYLQGTKI